VGFNVEAFASFQDLQVPYKNYCVSIPKQSTSTALESIVSQLKSDDVKMEDGADD
ncbi:hypothetical protein HDU76_004537, partial [Blyttiomyces sp. JEL0837]